MSSSSASPSIKRVLSELSPCRKCLRNGRRGPTTNRNLRSISTSAPSFASSTPSSSSSSFGSSRPRTKLRYIPISFFILPPVLWYLSQTSSESTLSAYVYTDHPVSSVRKISEQHKEVIISLSDTSSKAFAASIGSSSDKQTDVGDRTITVHHVMVKSPDLMIERPYTPVNDVEMDKEVRLIVKRVRGGEVGRLVHSLQFGQNVGLRGPIPTFSLDPTKYDRIIMVSSGTGIAPFLQYLSKLPSPSTVPGTSSRRTQFDLVHASPPRDRTDWVVDPALIPRLQAKHGDDLTIHRYLANSIPGEQLRQLVRGGKQEESVMVLVCLPPAMMRPLCGPLTVTLQQGELTGVLRDLGLEAHQVIKLE